MANITEMEKQPLLEAQQDTDKPEPSLAELQQSVRQAQREYFRAWSRTTSGKFHKRIMIVVTAIVTGFMIFCLALIVGDYLTEDDEWHIPQRVQLEAHIMSKCPDAKDCLHDLILPTMQNVSGKVDFRLSYIGTLTEQDGGVICKHGEEECLGNMVELCAAHLYPDPKIYLGFTMCMTRQYEDIPRADLVYDCALEHSISMAKLNECASADDGEKALDLLRESVNRSSNAGVTKSCTVRLGGKIRCIRDGGEWKECEDRHKPEDLIEDILALYG